MRLARIVHDAVAQRAAEIRNDWQAERAQAHYKQGDTIQCRIGIVTADVWGMLNLLLMDHGDGRLMYKPDSSRYRVWREVPNGDL